MAEKQLDNFLSQETQQLPESARNIFVAAFNSASDNGMDQEAARRVAWNTIEQDYEQGANGAWQRRPQHSNQTRKSVQSGGN